MPDEPDLPASAGEQRELLARLRAVIEAKDAEVVMLRAELSAERELRRRLELTVAELQRRLGMDSTNSGTPSSKESIGAREKRKAERKVQQSSERERRKDRDRGGQPGHVGSGLARDPDPDERREMDPPAQCSRCGAGLDGAEPAGMPWAQVWDVQISKVVTEYLLPSLACPCCGAVSTAAAPAGAYQGSVAYGPGINTAARGHRTLTITAKAARSSPSRSPRAPPGRSTWPPANAATGRSSSPKAGAGWTGTAQGGSSARRPAAPGSASPSRPTRSGTFITAALDAGVPQRDVQEAASHADPRTTIRYDRARGSLDRHATYIVAAYIAGAAR